jgi:GntR family transcriptional regulator/MocR family aminotransferase
MAERWSTLLGPDLHVDLDRGDLRRSLQNVLRDAVRDGRLPAGLRLPSTRTLAADLGVARGTVTSAYEQLVAEGYLTARRGSGTTAGSVPSPAAPASAAAPAQPRIRWDFTPGQPDLSAFPRTAWATATRRVLASCPNAELGYGDPQGSLALRRALAGYLGRARGVRTSPDQIVICAGYTSALSLICTVLKAGGTRAERTAAGDTARVSFEDPSLPHHRQVVTHTGLAVAGVPVDERGIRVGEIGAAIVVVTPAHQYPTGVTLDPGRRIQLADWARRTGGLVIEDDYDGEFRYDRQPVGAIQGLAPGHIVYAGTASKTLAPGLRLAWLALPPDLVGPVVATRLVIDRHPAVLEQLVLADMIGSGAYDRHIRQCRIRYRARRDRLLRVLRECAPAVAVRGISAGLHALAELPEAGPAEEELIARARRRQITVLGLAGHWIGTPARRPGLILGYATPAAHAYEPGLAALAGLLAEAYGPGRG